MKVAIISDIHENFHNLFLALEDMEQKGVEKILCLGDLINPGIAKVLAHCGIPVFMIWGNNDGDKAEIVKSSFEEGSTMEVSSNVYHFLEIDGKKIFVTHYFDLADPMAKSGDFDAVFYGHNHMKEKKQIGNCVVVNPGELAAAKTGVASYAVYDTDNGEVEIVDVANAISLKTEYATEKLKAYLATFNAHTKKAMDK